MRNPLSDGRLPSVGEEERWAADDAREQARRVRAERDALLARVIGEDGPEGLENLFPWRVRVEASSIDWLEPTCRVSIEAHPVWEAVMSKLGCGQRGRRTWALPVGKRASRENLLGALRSVPTRVTYMHHWLEKAHKRGGHPSGGAALYEVPWVLRDQTELGKSVGYGLHQAFGYVYTREDPEPPYRYGAVSLNTNGKELFFTCCTIKNGQDGLFLYEGAPNLNLWPLGDTRGHVEVLPAHAIAVMAVAEAEGLDVVAPDSLRDASDMLASGLVASRVAGAPGEVALLIGGRLAEEQGLDLASIADGVDWIRVWRGSSDAATVIIDRCRPTASVCVVDDAVDDAMRIATAEPTDVIDRPYQRIAVARHMATRIGYINASPVGSGKTPMALVGMREHARNAPRYRGLVACGSSVVGQWSSEAARFAPGLPVTVLQSKTAASELQRLADDRSPRIVVCSHDLARRWVEEISAIEWDDFVVDEAQLLKNPSSGRSKAMWAIRRSARRAVGLTGTPIDRSLDDLGAILAWVFDDRSLFFGERLSRRFSLRTREELWGALGAYVFRPNQSEVASQMPRLDTHIERITAHRSEVRLAQAAHQQLADAHRRMLARLEQQASIAPSAERELILQARAELAESRQAIASGVILARLATADPEALGRSESAGAMLLERDGLIRPAAAHHTKRTRVVQLVADRTSVGMGVLVFTDFSSVATLLQTALTDAGIVAETLLGSDSAGRRSDKQRRFQGEPCSTHADGVVAVTDCDRCVQPTIEALVLTGAGREGLNLQRATTVVMHDLPWIPSHVIQRIGRAQRIGGNERVEVVIPLVENTIEERVAAVLIPRIAQSLATLDPSISVGQSLMGFDELAKTLRGDEMDTFREIAGLPEVIDTPTLEHGESQSNTSLDETVGAESTLAGIASDVGDETDDPTVQIGDETTVALSGVLSQPHSVWSTALKAAGAKVVTSVGAQTAVLIAGARTGAKVEQAQHFGVEIIDEATARQRLGIHAP